MIDPITSIVTVPAVVALTNLAKGLGVGGKWSALVAVLLGVTLAVAAHSLAGTGWFDAASTGLLLGLAAAGLYDLTPDAGGEV
ncbi:hypothetical protein [uncultured Tessaracoccus sp.]|uniref:hypothetical protein n=1 Tax=uncultured Tessaracoccus sp. TaxID=905023 RepID=UPI0026112E9B|nr:hypothetical protein [uncultured Tessaracoccus sp.]